MFPSSLSISRICFGNVNRDITLKVAGDNTILILASRVIGEEMKCKPVFGCCGLALKRETETKDTVNKSMFGDFELFP